jgi:hypothetical protein
LIEPLGNLKRKHAIIWIMVKAESSNAETDARRSNLRSKTFFSTLEYAEVPNAATDLFSPLIQQLQEEWNGIYRAAEQHLNDKAGTSFPFGDLD